VNNAIKVSLAGKHEPRSPQHYTVCLQRCKFQRNICVRFTPPRSWTSRSALRATHHV